RQLFMQLFFFSSRRRHTRFSRDWSSDVCSSDLSPNGRSRPEMVRSSLFAFSMCSVLQCGAGAVVRQLIKVGQVQLDTVSSGRNVVHGQARLEHCTPEIESVVVELDAAAFLRRVGQAR